MCMHKRLCHYSNYDYSADTGPDFISMAIDIKENMYKHAFELDQSDLPIDESRQPLREVRVTR